MIFVDVCLIVNTLRYKRFPKARLRLCEPPYVVIVSGVVAPRVHATNLRTPGTYQLRAALPKDLAPT